MANPILSKKKDKSIAKALADALKGDKSISFDEVIEIILAAFDGEVVDDVEFRDIRKIIRTKPLGTASRLMFELFLQRHYPLEGPFTYPKKLDDLEGAKLVGSGQCAALVQGTIPIGLAATWREGIPVRGNDALITKGTAIATFEDGHYANRDHGNHVAYYISQDSTGIEVMDQWSSKGSVSSRTMGFLGRHANGSFVDPSNNGDALSVIMKKKV